MCEIDSDETCEVFNETTRTARKSHRCACCRGMINKGERYLVHFSVLAGDITNEKMCRFCTKSRSEFAKQHDGILFSPSVTREVIGECLSQRQSFSSMRKWARVLRDMKKRKDECGAKV